MALVHISVEDALLFFFSISLKVKGFDDIKAKEFDDRNFLEIFNLISNLNLISYFDEHQQFKNSL